MLLAPTLLRLLTREQGSDLLRVLLRRYSARSSPPRPQLLTTPYSLATQARGVGRRRTEYESYDEYGRIL